MTADRPATAPRPHGCICGWYPDGDSWVMAEVMGCPFHGGGAEAAQGAAPRAEGHGVGFVDKVGIECLCGWTCFFDNGGWVTFNEHLAAPRESEEGHL